MPDLTTLDAVKAFLVVTTSNQDALISRLISRESRLIEEWCGRSSFSPVTRTAQRINGSGSSMLPLPDAPILSVSVLSDCGTQIPVSASAGSYGYTFDESRLYLNGGVFSRGRQNITCTYTAGYQASETATIPSDNPAKLTPTTGGTAISVVSVVNAAGAALTQVAASPATGQFSFAAGCFTFAAADVGTSVTLTYGYAPAPVEQACIEMVGLDLKSRDNLGITSKSLAGETISYSSRGLTDSVKEQLMPYRRMLIA
jgi:hypothetical protein